MTDSRHILFLCTGNSARSILAEAYLNASAQGRFRGFSAGSHPSGAPHPIALATLEAAGIATAGLRSKSWHEFSAANAPRIDCLITVCDNAAGEVCPIWPGRPSTVHWAFRDPAARKDNDARMRAEFLQVFAQIRAHLDALTVLPGSALELPRVLLEIGEKLAILRSTSTTTEIFS